MKPAFSWPGRSDSLTPAICTGITELLINPKKPKTGKEKYSAKKSKEDEAKAAPSL